jgi:hypothetical protein
MTFLPDIHRLIVSIHSEELHSQDFDDCDCCKTYANVKDEIKKPRLEIAHATEKAILS